MRQRSREVGDADMEKNKSGENRSVMFPVPLIKCNNNHNDYAGWAGLYRGQKVLLLSKLT